MITIRHPKRKTFSLPENPRRLSETLSGTSKVLLLRRVGGVGDVLNCRMLFYDIKAQSNGRAEVHFAVPRDLVPLVSDHPYIDRVIPLDEAEAVINGENYGFVGDVTTACVRHEVAFRGAVHLQRADIWAKHIGIELTRRDLDLRFTDAEIDHAKKILRVETDDRPLILVCPTSAADSRNLPRHILEETLLWGAERGYRLVMSATKNYGEDLFPDRAVFSDLRTWMASFVLADGCVTTDTGALHAAGGADCPTIAAFGYTSAFVVPRHYRSVLGVQLHRSLAGGLQCCPCYDWSSCPHISPNEPALPLKCFKDISEEQWRTALDEKISTSIASGATKQRRETSFVATSMKTPRWRSEKNPTEKISLLKIDLREATLLETISSLEALNSRPVPGRAPEQSGPTYSVLSRYDELLSECAYPLFVFGEAFRGSPDVSPKDVSALASKRVSTPFLRLPSHSKFVDRVETAICDRKRLSPMSPSGSEAAVLVWDSCRRLDVSRAIDVVSSDVVVTGNADLASLAASLGVPCVFCGSRGSAPKNALVFAADTEASARSLAWEIYRKDRIFVEPGASDAIALASRVDPTSSIFFSPPSTDGGPGVKDAVRAALGEVVPCPGSGTSVSARENYPLWGGRRATNAVDIPRSTTIGRKIRVPETERIDGVKPSWENWVDGKKCGWSEIVAFHPISRTRRCAADGSIPVDAAAVIASTAMERGTRVMCLGGSSDGPQRYASAGERFLDLVGKTSIAESFEICEKAGIVVACPSSLAAHALNNPTRSNAVCVWDGPLLDAHRFPSFGQLSCVDLRAKSASEVEAWLPYRLRPVPEHGEKTDRTVFVFTVVAGEKQPIPTPGLELIAVVPTGVSVELVPGVRVVHEKNKDVSQLSRRLSIIGREIASDERPKWVWSSDGFDAAEEAKTVARAVSHLMVVRSTEAPSRTCLMTTRGSGALTPGAKTTLRHDGLGPSDLIDPASWGCHSSVFSAFVGRGTSFKQESPEAFAVKLWRSRLSAVWVSPETAS